MADEPRLSLPDRLRLLYERLSALPPAKTADEAFRQLAETLDQVEDEHSGVERNPNPGLKFDGRMYPPREDFTERLPDGGLRATTKGNLIEISPGGTTDIYSRHTNNLVFRRPGADAQLDPELQKLRELNATNHVTGSRAASPSTATPAVQQPPREDRTPER
ncbi:hypothetical protein [Kribbella sp. NPDC051770]|uniref:hypothetical protein n=1 Tax=Kribbella sp. NPDC051770 TaxID=3155413 RepID=UPI003425D9F1